MYVHMCKYVCIWIPVTAKSVHEPQLPCIFGGVTIPYCRQSLEAAAARTVLLPNGVLNGVISSNTSRRVIFGIKAPVYLARTSSKVKSEKGLTPIVKVSSPCFAFRLCSKTDKTLLLKVLLLPLFAGFFLNLA